MPMSGLGVQGVAGRKVGLAVMKLSARGSYATAPCPAQKSVTKVAISEGHSREGRARDPVRTAELASFIEAVV